MVVMMDIKEIIDQLEKHYEAMRIVSCVLVPDEESKRNVEAIKEASELLKRFIPMKPTLNESHSYVSDAFNCSKCGHTIRFHAKYYENCGQGVKWNA